MVKIAWPMVCTIKGLSYNVEPCALIAWAQGTLAVASFLNLYLTNFGQTDNLC
jgi:hypothetical protein